MAIILLLIPLGFICRFAPIGLPPVIVKYGGSFLWAALVYWCIAFLLPRKRSITIALVAIIVSAGVEFAKLIRSPGLDAFRDTFTGKVLLGRYFSYTDILVYSIAILCALWIDQTAIHGWSASRE